MSGTRSRRDRQARLLADLDRALMPEPRRRLLVIIWRWRYELGLVAAVTAGLATVGDVLGARWAVIGAAALVGRFGPPWPQSYVARAWCVITPHRLRAGFTQARLHTRQGRLPVIMRTTRTPFGEHVRLWCPAGISAEDIRSARATLRAACWAADVKVIRDKRHAQIVTVEVIRRHAHHIQDREDHQAEAAS
jgi:hypothetical protein